MLWSNPAGNSRWLHESRRPTLRQDLYVLLGDQPYWYNMLLGEDWVPRWRRMDSYDGEIEFCDPAVVPGGAAGALERRLGIRLKDKIRRRRARKEMRRAFQKARRAEKIPWVK